MIALLQNPAHDIITTVIDKFEAAARSKLVDTNRDIFVLVDESHRGQWGGNHARMQGVLPMACYIGFTGTPLLSKEKSTAEKFGGFIHTYSMRQAVADKAVVPLLYEGRMVDLDVSRDALDQWFERRTASLNEDQKTSLKRKMSRFDEVNRVQSRLEAIAWDIAEHYKKNWQGTGFKGQLATASKDLAIFYRKALLEEGIKCEVIISAPDTREGSDDGDDDALPEVQKFWKQMMQRYGSEEAYLKEVVKSFGEVDGFEILIVVDKLLVGFDEPRNTILYIDKPLREHGLLQAIARVNRLSAGKDYGYLLDYRGVLGQLNEAMQTYNALEAFDAEDVAGTVTDIKSVVAELPSLHNQVWALFDPVNTHDQEALERFLEPLDRRQTFYEALNTFTKALSVALSMTEFYQTTPETLINTYKRDLIFFDRLRASVKLRYAETVDYGEYEQKIRKLLNDHIKAEGVHTLIPTVNIFDEIAFEAAVEHLSDGARADTIANHVKKTATEHMDEDPAFYRKFSQLIDDTLQEYRDGRISEAEKLQRVEAALRDIRQGHDSGIPEPLTQSPNAAAYYGLLTEVLTPRVADGETDFSATVADLALILSDTIERLKVRDWVTNPHRIDTMKGALEEHLYTFSKAHTLDLSFNELDLILDSLLETARKRDSL